MTSSSLLPLSDIDVAILHADTLDPSRRLDLRLGLMSRAGTALATAEVDVVLLNGAPALRRDRVLRDGRVLIDRDPGLTARFRQETSRGYSPGTNSSVKCFSVEGWQSGEESVPTAL